MSIESDEKYVDLLLTNSIQSHSNQRVAVSFNQNQSQPVLKSTNNYQLSIIRFSLNTETLPIFIPVMQSTNTTIYSCTMEINGVQYQQFMQYEPQNLNPADPDEYYYIYNYQFLIYLVNKCLTSCLSGLAAQTTIPATQAPIITFDATSQKCTLSLDDDAFGYNEYNKINIYMNGAMYAIFASMPSCMVYKNSLGMDYQLNNLISQDSTALTQDYSTVALWNPVASVIFTSNLIPIYQSQTPPIQIYENGRITNNSSNFNYLNVLTDFVANDMQFVPYIQYAPSVYRYLSLKPNTEVRNIDLQVFWQNKNSGTLKPLYMGVGGSASVKLFLSPIN